MATEPTAASGEHWRKMFDEKYVGSWDLPDDHPEVTMTITSVRREELMSEKGKTHKPVIYFKESKSGKGMVLNKTNAKALAKAYGNDVTAWAGKRVTIYKATCDAFGQQVECLRVRC